MLKRIDIYEKYNDRPLIMAVFTTLSDSVIKMLYEEWYIKAQNSSFNTEFLDYVRLKHKECVIAAVEEVEAYSIFVE